MRDRQREKQAPCREPDVGLDPGSPGSHRRLQVAPNRCATRAAPKLSRILFSGESLYFSLSSPLTLFLAIFSVSQIGE